MRYRVLGGTGIEVSVHCLGTMMFGAVGNPDHDDSARIIHAALDAGINFVDTADMYSAGESEEIVGKALQGRRDDVVLATKVHFPMGEGRNRGGNSRRWIVNEVEESLRRLRTDWIDLYQVHRPGPHDRHRGDAVGADRPRAGGQDPRVRLLDVPGGGHRRGIPRRGTPWPAPVPHRTAAVLAAGAGIETSVLPTCERLGMGVLTWSPLASGVPVRPVPRGPAGRHDHRPGRADAAAVRPVAAGERGQVRRHRAAGRVADDLGCTLPELAVAFPVAHPAVTSVITGPRTMDAPGVAAEGRRR